MLLATLAVLALAQAPSDAAPIKVGVNELALVNLDPKLGGLYTGSLAQELSFQGVRTVTGAEMAAVLGLERQRQLAGCPDDSCRANLAEALGVDGLLVGTISKLESLFTLDVKVVRAGDGRALAFASTTSQTQEGIVEKLRLVAEQLALQLSTSLGRPLVKNASVEIVTTATRVKRLSWVPAAAGVAAVVAGGVLLGMAKGNYDLLTKSQGQPLEMGAYDGAVNSGKLQQTLGWSLVGVGAACVVGGLAMFLFGGDETVRAGVAVVPGGAGVSFTGVW